mmetsp:Transcript_124591/g.398915  ORF Transcript_124591/g.398915 Transcript_124591/m.398915 type:complete len:232 (-) Transcript_124591:5782-6477(-)
MAPGQLRPHPGVLGGLRDGFVRRRKLRHCCRVSGGRGCAPWWSGRHSHRCESGIDVLGAGACVPLKRRKLRSLGLRPEVVLSMGVGVLAVFAARSLDRALVTTKSLGYQVLPLLPEPRSHAPHRGARARQVGWRQVGGRTVRGRPRWRNLELPAIRHAYWLACHRHLRKRGTLDGCRFTHVQRCRMQRKSDRGEYHRSRPSRSLSFASSHGLRSRRHHRVGGFVQPSSAGC